MALPANFSGPPGEELHRTFRNACIELKKMVKNSPNFQQLEQEVDRFLHMGQEMDWHHKNTGTYHKDAGPKAMNKVRKEADRYLASLKHTNPGPMSPQDFLEALSEVEQLIDSYRVT
jgi:hypothetical protein